MTEVEVKQIGIELTDIGCLDKNDKKISVQLCCEPLTHNST